MTSTRVVVVGAGPIGAAVAREITGRTNEGAQLVAVVDVDPARHGAALDGVTNRSGVVVTPELPAAGTADVAVVCTTSSFTAIVPTLRACLARGLHVVSTCEELVWPFLHHAALAKDIDDAAVAAGRAVVGTGINPGFLMDALPAFLTSICSRVDCITVVRAQDAATRRLPFQHKVGVGLSIAEFDQRVARGGFLHRGLAESAALLAHALGLMPADCLMREHHAAVVDDVGRVKGVEQSCIVDAVAISGASDRVERIVLRFEAWAGHPQPRDEIIVTGEPSLKLVTTGVHGDVATRAIAVNAIPAVLRARPGLRTMLDLPLPASVFAR